MNPFKAIGAWWQGPRWWNRPTFAELREVEADLGDAHQRELDIRRAYERLEGEVWKLREQLHPTPRAPTAPVPPTHTTIAPGGQTLPPGDSPVQPVPFPTTAAGYEAASRQHAHTSLAPVADLLEHIVSPRSLIDPPEVHPLSALTLAGIAAAQLPAETDHPGCAQPGENRWSAVSSYPVEDRVIQPPRDIPAQGPIFPRKRKKGRKS